MAMIRKQVYIEAEQDAALKQLSASLSVSEAELIRRAIELLAGVQPGGYRTPEATTPGGIREVATLPYGAGEMQTQNSHAVNEYSLRRRLDRRAWLDELAFMEERARAGGLASGEADRWNRDEAYDKRRLRLPD